MFDIPRERIGLAKGPSVSELSKDQAAKLNYSDAKVTAFRLCVPLC